MDTTKPFSHFNRHKGLIDYIYNNYKNDYRLNVIRFIRRFGGCVGSGADNKKYAHTLFPDEKFSSGSRDCGLVILEPQLIDTLKSQYSYTEAKHVIIDFDNDKIKWDVFTYWNNMTAFLNDPMSESLYLDNPYYTAKYYNEPIDIVPFEKINIVEDLLINQNFVLDKSKAIFAKIE